LVNSVLSISFNTPDCLIVTIGTVCENQDTSMLGKRVDGATANHAEQQLDMLEDNRQQGAAA
ncbi:hypothetical protein ACW5W8_12645, partial [Aeromonas aquatilis]